MRRKTMERFYPCPCPCVRTCRSCALPACSQLDLCNWSLTCRPSLVLHDLFRVSQEDPQFAGFPPCQHSGWRHDPTCHLTLGVRAATRPLRVQMQLLTVSRAHTGVLSVRVTLFFTMANAVCVVSGCTCVRCVYGHFFSRSLCDQHRSALHAVQAESGIPGRTWVRCQYGISPAWSLPPFCWASRVYMGTLLVREIASLYSLLACMLSD